MDQVCSYSLSSLCPYLTTLQSFLIDGFNIIDPCLCHFAKVQLWGKLFRRQVLWMAKQILQLGMGDAIDDWLLGRIQWLRREEVVALGIQWVKGVRLAFFYHLYIIYKFIRVGNKDSIHNHFTSSLCLL